MRLHPKGIFLAVGVILPVVISLGLILQAGWDDAPGAVPGPAAFPDGSAVVRTLDLRFVREGEDRIQVEEARTGRVLRTVTALDGGFLWGILRPLERERERHGAALDAPYRLTQAESGRLTLEDPESDLEVELAAFGATSDGLFRSLLSGGPGPSVPPLFPSSPSMEDRP
jgi:putative photosynthetic complex assembly protein